MQQRTARLRREYLYRKDLEGKEIASLDRRKQLKQAIDEGKRIPTELQAEADKLKAELDLVGLEAQIDDEYNQAGVYDPKVILTTSRDPSSRLTQFLKEMRLIIPNSERINRGNMELSTLVETCRANEVTDLVVVTETRGEPDGMIVSHFPNGPTAMFTISNAILRHDIANRGTMSEAYPHLIFQGFTSKLGKRVMNVLKYLFPVPKPDSKRVISFINNEDMISFRHHNFTKTNTREVDLNEVGPRFELRPYQIKLGTIEMKTADTEWVLKPYMNSAKRRKLLTE
eukprot:c7603_g1_i1.p1 GENE.c7603_g1_i1~~c7603_g1_i1.p1  ORF type:complete len:285 (+),score=67.18 c7603_g1_i1:27-881(+)